MSLISRIDFYELILAHVKEWHGGEKFIGDFRNFLSEVGFEFVKAKLKENCQEILRPFTALVNIEEEQLTRLFLEEILEHPGSFSAMSTENGLLFLSQRGARRLIRYTHEGKELRREVRVSKLFLTHVKTKEGKNLNQICGTFFKGKKAKLVSEGKGESCEILNKRLSNFSSSGKLFSKRGNREKALALIEPRTWQLVSKINEKEGGVAYSKDIKNIGRSLKLGSKELESLVNDLLGKKLVSRLLQIVCHKCGAPSVRTEASTDIKKLLSEIRCGVCNEELTASDVQEVFVLPRDVISLSNGLWLEEYVRNIVEKMCSKVWQGRFLGNDELDVVGLKHGNVFLFECKTTNIGHTDVYNLVIKARRLGANSCMIVTTAKIVENARKAIEELSRTEGIRIYPVEGDTDKIRKLLIEHIENRISQVLRNAFFESMGIPAYRVRRASM